MEDHLQGHDSSSQLNKLLGQVFRFAARRNLLTEELVMRLAYLSGYEKDYKRKYLSGIGKGL